MLTDYRHIYVTLLRTIMESVVIESVYRYESSGILMSLLAYVDMALVYSPHPTLLKHTRPFQIPFGKHRHCV